MTAPEQVTISEHPRGELVGDPIAVTIRRVALPAVVANLLMTAFHSIDTFWIGRSLGAEALAAVTGSVFWVWLVISIGEMVSIGLDAIAARRHGERRPEDAARTVSDGFVLALLLGAVIAIATPFVLSTLFTMLGTDASVSAIGRKYLGTYFIGMPLIFGFFAVDAAFRAKGDTRTPLVLLTVTTILGLLLDPLLIRGGGPVPAFGVQGAAMATLVPRGLACVAGVWILMRRGMLAWATPRWDVLSRIVQVGAPAAMTGVAFSAIYVLLTRITTQFGTPALAALGLGFRIESVVYVVSVGMGAAVAAIVGQSLGAGDTERASRVGWIATGLVSVIGVATAAVSLFAADSFAGIFSDDPAVIAEAAHYLRIAAFCQLFLGAEVVLESAMGGAGWTVVPMVCSTVITLMRLPVGAWAAAQWGTTGLWWTLAVTAALRGVAMAALWRWGRWRKTTV
ncbi:MAG: MATE family efflux transporter [Gemmatimonadaceae bacterium]|nr:MATE family efflux transporter [Gemmatimonadaceae bacterium]